MQVFRQITRRLEAASPSSTEVMDILSWYGYCLTYIPPAISWEARVVCTPAFFGADKSLL